MIKLLVRLYMYTSYMAISHRSAVNCQYAFSMAFCYLYPGSKILENHTPYSIASHVKYCYVMNALDAGQVDPPRGGLFLRI